MTDGGQGEHDRVEPPPAGDELAVLTGFLDYQRATLAWKTRGLDAEGLGVTVAASTVTLGGLLKHLAFVEEMWLSRRLLGRDWGPAFADVDWDDDPDWEWHSAADDTPEQLRALWSGAVERSRVILAEAVADGGLDRLAAASSPDGTTPSLRWILVHRIEEYARHNGHADLIREWIDGEVGE
ncbi:DUF664 domain-containing protein [Blastococcus sp. TML/M2B]|uniref:DinB family protein n=1 Tax=unclassified Blastococcus TaxID=2619396 RepID=UPI00190B9C9B|nr:MULTISPECIES: DinB family protein [unclassified Blastococcus]MBN1094512.1 DUF664 domain-containing protein [Blastococcus sp. TML/M2B]MBN1095471.1 DUF664 domain-containing protein [Blastococcus sp. TML/C7B]